MKQWLSGLLIFTFILSISTLSFGSHSPATDYDITHTTENLVLASQDGSNVNQTTTTEISAFADRTLGALTHDTLNNTIDSEARLHILMMHKNTAAIEFNPAIFDEAGTLNDTEQEIAAFNVVNNTMDGFTVTMKSANGGKLLPVGPTKFHGETYIPYTVNIDKGASAKLNDATGQDYSSGIVGGGVISVLSIQTLTNTNEVAILTGQGQTSPTNATYSVNVKLDNTEGYGLAGEYKDSLVIIYRDY